MREKHTALMKPIVFALEHVRSITAAPAETPHEKWFQDTYGDAIENALEKLKNPLNPAKPGSSWLPFKEVLYIQIKSIMQRLSTLLLQRVLVSLLSIVFLLSWHFKIAA